MSHVKPMCVGMLNGPNIKRILKEYLKYFF